MKLLIVDDNQEMVETLSCIMELAGHRVDEAYDGVEAVERLRSNSYDVVITDAEMPRMGGIEVCKFLKEEFSGVYIIGMTGSIRALKAFKDAGADICFFKPVDFFAVEKVIEDRFAGRLN